MQFRNGALPLRIGVCRDSPHSYGAARCGGQVIADLLLWSIWMKQVCAAVGRSHYWQRQAMCLQNATFAIIRSIQALVCHAKM